MSDHTFTLYLQSSLELLPRRALLPESIAALVAALELAGLHAEVVPGVDLLVEVPVETGHFALQRRHDLELRA